MKIKGAIVTRTRFAFLIMALFAIAIVVKMGTIQYNSDWKVMAEKIDVRLRPVKASRGNIYSDNGSLLATSLPTYNLAFDPSVTLRRDTIYQKEADSLCYLLAQKIGNNTAAGYRRLIDKGREKKRQYMRLGGSAKLNYHEKKEMEQWPLFRYGQMNGGVIFEKVERREHPFKGLAFRTLGYIANDGRKVGLEFSFDSLLTGKEGKALFARIGKNRWKPIRDEHAVKPQNGYDIHSTININYQDVAEDALEKALRYHDAEHGFVIVMETQTGEIKAIANLDKVVKENKEGEEETTYRERLNYALVKRNEPGSTFKLASMMAAFEKLGDDVTLDTKINCTKTGKYKFFDRWMYDSHVVGEEASIRDVFAYSSNIGAAKLAFDTFYKKKETQDQFSNYFTQFGLRDNLQFQIKGIANSSIKTPDSELWSGTSVPWIATGYELEATPLQLLTFYNAVANDGKMLQPIIVKTVQQADKMIHEYEAKVLREQIASPRTISMARDMLESVVEYGTAKRIKSKEYKIAGKTGTAKKLVGGKYTNLYYASFIGYFPADAPKYTCIVGIDSPHENGYYGSNTAAPVFKEISDYIYVSDLEMHGPTALSTNSQKGDYPYIKAGNQEDINAINEKLNLNIWQGDSEGYEWVEIQENKELGNVLLTKRVVEAEKIPNVHGMTLKDALPLLENVGLHVSFSGIGRVTRQSLTAGENLIIGSKIELVLN